MTDQEMTRLLEELQTEIDAAFKVTTDDATPRYRDPLSEIRAAGFPIRSDSAIRSRR
jgi:hypothetical protein